MKRNNIYTIAISGLLLAGSMMFSSCTGEYEKWNHDPNAATEEDMTHDNLLTGGPFSQMQRGVFIVGKDLSGEYQISEMLQGDLFASYIAPITSWGYTSRHNDHYQLYPNWYNAAFTDAYTNIMLPWKQIYDNTDEVSPARAMATIVKVLAMQRITDMYGPIPYSQFGVSASAAYDKQEDIYNQFFTEIADAIDVLTNYAQNQSTYMADYDNVYQGNVVKWVKMANTLRLRLAMRISNVNESKAREQIQAVLSNSIGLMQDSGDDAYLRHSSTLSYNNPMWEVSESWDDEHMSATMDCYLNGLADPRISAYFQECTDGGGYHGARNGMPNPNKGNYQGRTSRMKFTQDSDMPWMKAAEAYFLMAEAKLRFDLGSESAQSYYENGIRTAFSSWSVNGADAYISNDTNLPLKQYTDPYNNRSTTVENMLTNVTVKWGDNNDDNLKRIALQKWIALYPDGQEAWSEMRRTGYPGIVTIQSNDSQGEVPNGELISRLKFPTTEYSNNSANTQAAVSLLGGQDIAGIRLWWDVKR